MGLRKAFLRSVLTSSAPYYPLRRITRWELIASLGVAAVAAPFAGLHGAISGVLGGLVNIVAAAAYVLLVHAGGMDDPGNAVRTMLRAEAGKIAVIVFLLWLV